MSLVKYFCILVSFVFLLSGCGVEHRYYIRYKSKLQYETIEIGNHNYVIVDKSGEDGGIGITHSASCPCFKGTKN